MGVYTVSGNRFRVWAATHLGVYTPGGLHSWGSTPGVYTPGSLHCLEQPISGLGGHSPGSLHSWGFTPGGLQSWRSTLSRATDFGSWRPLTWGSTLLGVYGPGGLDCLRQPISGPGSHSHPLEELYRTLHCSSCLGNEKTTCCMTKKPPCMKLEGETCRKF